MHIQIKSFCKPSPRAPAAQGSWGKTIALKIGSILEAWVLAWQSKAVMEAETRDCRSCRVFPRRHRATPGNTGMLLPRWSGKSLERATRMPRRAGSWRRIKGLGKGLPQVAGIGRESTSQRHRCAQPSWFSRAPVSCKAVALTGCFLALCPQEGFSEDADSLPSIILNPAEPG